MANEPAATSGSLRLYRCSASGNCLHQGWIEDAPSGQGSFDEYDRYGIYAGKWHPDCWNKFGYKDFEFDPMDAGESLEADY